MRALAVLALPIVACSDPGAASPQVDHVEPPYGPLVGGTTVRVDGSGFSSATRVMIGGREAPLVQLREPSSLDVVIPPGDEPGDVEVVVLDATGYSTRRDVFRYSEPPVIGEVSPRDVWIGSTDIRVTVTGGGFHDENAGEVHVLVGGMLVESVTVESDASLSFIAPPGQVFAREDIEVINQRGSGRDPRALRYTPGTHPGLLLFPRYSSVFVDFYDPVEQTSVSVPWRSSTQYPFTTVMRDRDGQYWSVDYANRVGKLDLAEQIPELIGTMSVRVPASTRIGDDIVALTRSSGVTFGRFYPEAFAFTPLGTAPIFCCGGFGLASDGTTVWIASRADWSTFTINTIDPTTGALGTPVTLTSTSAFRIEELRYFAGVLYGANAYGGIVTIDPATGVVTTLPLLVSRYNAIEIYE